MRMILVRWALLAVLLAMTVGGKAHVAASITAPGPIFGGSPAPITAGAARQCISIDTDGTSGTTTLRLWSGSLVTSPTTYTINAGKSLNLTEEGFLEAGADSGYVDTLAGARVNVVAWQR